MWQSIFFVDTKLFGIVYRTIGQQNSICYDTATNTLQILNFNRLDSYHNAWHKWTQELSFQSYKKLVIYSFSELAAQPKIQAKKKSEETIVPIPAKIKLRYVVH